MKLISTLLLLLTMVANGYCQRTDDKWVFDTTEADMGYDVGAEVNNDDGLDDQDTNTNPNGTLFKYVYDGDATGSGETWAKSWIDLTQTDVYSPWMDGVTRLNMMAKVFYDNDDSFDRLPAEVHSSGNHNELTIDALFGIWADHKFELQIDIDLSADNNAHDFSDVSISGTTEMGRWRMNWNVQTPSSTVADGTIDNMRIVWSMTEWDGDSWEDMSPAQGGTDWGGTWAEPSTNVFQWKKTVNIDDKFYADGENVPNNLNIYATNIEADVSTFTFEANGQFKQRVFLIPGDFDKDGDVDDDDSDTQDANYPTSSGATWAEGDTDDDGDIDFTDFLKLSANYGYGV